MTPWSCSHRGWGSSSAPKSQSLGLKHQALGCGLPQAARGDASLSHHRRVRSWPTAAVAARAGSQASAGRTRVPPSPIPGKPQQPWGSGASYRGWRKLWTSAQFGGVLFECTGGPIRDWYPHPQTRGRMPGCKDRPHPPTPTPSVGDAPILPTSCKQHHHGHAHPRGRGLLVGSWRSTPHPTVPWQAAWGSLTFVSLSPLLASQPHPRVTPNDMK